MMEQLRKLAADKVNSATEYGDGPTLLWAVERIDELETTLTRIRQWCDAYPITVFPPLPDSELKRADKALDTVGISMTRLHGSWGRHIVQGIGDIIKMVLP
jgi:hypothetical protein